jgi:hypothetical protein
LRENKSSTTPIESCFCPLADHSAQKQLAGTCNFLFLPRGFDSTSDAAVRPGFVEQSGSHVDGWPHPWQPLSEPDRAMTESLERG